MKEKHSNNKDQRMRQQLAQEAARIIAEEGIKDFYVAKQKAAERLHAPHTHNLPRNDEIKWALDQYQRLFKSDSQPSHLQQLRQSSLEAMQFFKHFEPRLVGPVLDGSANEFSDINLQLFADTPEELSIFLMEHHIPFELKQKKFSMADGKTIEQPSYEVVLEDVLIELSVFDRHGLRQAPTSPITGKPMQRASLASVAELLEKEKRA